MPQGLNLRVFLYYEITRNNSPKSDLARPTPWAGCPFWGGVQYFKRKIILKVSFFGIFGSEP